MLKSELTIAEIAGKYQIHPNLVAQWEKKLISSASEIFQTRNERKVETRHKALEAYGRSKIYTSDQGSQFTSNELISELEMRGITISMDDRGVVWIMEKWNASDGR